MSPEKDPNDAADNTDNDCNGEVDEGFNVGTECVGKGVCTDGTLECNENGELQCSTMPGGKDDQSGKEVCNGLDDDGVPDACDNSKGYNPSQADSDFDGMGNKTDNAPDCFNPEQVDNDGDGSPAGCVQTKGECGKKLGTATCDGNGAWGVCVGDTKPAAEVCDIKDNDCNGGIDEGFDGGAPCTPKK